ncbi:putative RNA-dependent RNA polymerase [Freshwater macrophyte associated tombus-like virus 2]|nr:putative RNA-dependent RNA polymerase [Freshwater macrophyte associated tombus-like virus 2]
MGKERVVRILAGLGAGVNYGVHANNLQNLMRGITERVLYVVRGGCLSKVPQPLEGVFAQRLGKLRGRLVRRMPPTPIVDIQDFPELYTGRKRAVYQRAADSLLVRGVSKADSFVSTFLKAEKINFSAKADPAPRVIQPRAPRYNVMVGRYLKLFEKQVFAAFHREFRYPVVLKGLNAQQVGGWMADHWAQFSKPCAVGLDASRFDQHVSQQALQFEHSFYNAAFQSRELRQLLSWQLRNKGIARTPGWRLDYLTDGCRMSGDMNTGLGNCILMACMVIGYCEQAGLKYRLANNGDDCVVFIESADLPRLDGIDRWMLDFGFTLTREDAVYELEKVVFCQAQPVLTDSGWRMVRDPFTAMSKDCVSLVSWDKEVDVRYWATAIGKCGYSLTCGVPVWEAWYGQLLRLGGGVEARGVDDEVNRCGMSYMARGVIGCDITDEARVSFWRAFGVLPDAQIALEHHYAQPMAVDFQVRPMMVSPIITLDRANNPLSNHEESG